ncbi:hypothetical protein GGQ55_003316 [Geodermatophilus daqingensis]|uniref:Uncharacterized protein n=1 Tax=Petropleomorpha daqingensis TaxID=2026353 RepID=A0A853CLA6_9ACTN|nr:hypothetical protein [Petropleomorpha daqingensis]
MVSGFGQLRFRQDGAQQNPPANSHTNERVTKRSSVERTPGGSVERPATCACVSLSGPLTDARARVGQNGGLRDTHQAHYQSHVPPEPTLSEETADTVGELLVLGAGPKTSCRGR